MQPDEADALARASPSAPGTTRSSRALTDYIAIPAKSPMFDADWQKHGYIDRVVRDAASWVESKQGRRA